MTVTSYPGQKHVSGYNSYGKIVKFSEFSQKLIIKRLFFFGSDVGDQRLVGHVVENDEFRQLKFL